MSVNKELYLRAILSLDTIVNSLTEHLFNHLTANEKFISCRVLYTYDGE